jgi:hypothetical protein
MKNSEADAIANPGTGGARAVGVFSGQPDLNVSITRTPRKLTVDPDALPPAREDGPRPIPRRFAGRMYEALTSSGARGEGMSLPKSVETYGTTKVFITRNIVGVNGQHWFEGDEVAGIPVNLAIQLVSDKSAYFDKGEFKSEGEIEALEKLGYEVLPPMLKAKDRPEFASVITRKTSKWMAGTITPTPATS